MACWSERDAAAADRLAVAALVAAHVEADTRLATRLEEMADLMDLAAVARELRETAEALRGVANEEKR